MRADGGRVVSGLLVAVEGSAPFRPGAALLVSERGEVEGSITGGCVEGAVAEEALAMLAAGGPAKRLTFGISDELAGTVGLACGGTVHVFVHELSPAAATVEQAAEAGVEEGRAVAVATLLSGERAGAKLALVDEEAVGSLGGPELLDHSVARDAAGMLAQGVTGIRRYGSDGATLGDELEVHVSSFAPPPAMLIFGAVEFSAALARIAGELGYRTTICDPREPFLRSARFAAADELVHGWPQEAFAGRRLGPRDAVLIFSHDAKLDVPAVQGALASGAGFVGALGSRKTTADRERRLREAGTGDTDLARLHAPCGLDIGASTPEEVAISVLAEIFAARSGRPGTPLREGSSPLHPPAPV